MVDLVMADHGQTVKSIGMNAALHAELFKLASSSQMNQRMNLTSKEHALTSTQLAQPT
jgi:hypothetical protein